MSNAFCTKGPSQFMVDRHFTEYPLSARKTGTPIVINRRKSPPFDRASLAPVNRRNGTAKI